MSWQFTFPSNWHTVVIPILGIVASLAAYWIGKILDRRKREAAEPNHNERFHLDRLSRSQERRLKLRVEGTLK
jgi:hypothetical protein